MDDCASSRTPAPDAPGYDVGRCLGRGGSATVWLVTELSTGRDYALKCFPAGDSTGRDSAEKTDASAATKKTEETEEPKNTEATVETVRREVRILSALDHDHLVRAHAVLRLAGPWTGSLGLVFDYAPGGSLWQLVACRGRLGAGETVTVLTPIAQALAYLHGHGFTHGDVSPGNVLFTAHGKPLLADLGVARMVADANGVADAGTEGFRDPAPVDAVRAGLQPERDVYSLAALGWFCLTGHAPEPGARRPPLPLLVPGVPPALAAALESGLQEDRRLRPAAAELASAVHRSAVAEPVDLSVSVHPTVIPQLLTRRSVRGAAQERRIDKLRSLPGRIPTGIPARSRAGSAAGRAAGRAAGFHSARRDRSGRSAVRPGSQWSRRVLGAAAVCLALAAVLVGAWALSRAGLPMPFPREAGQASAAAQASGSAVTDESPDAAHLTPDAALPGPSGSPGTPRSAEAAPPDPGAAPRAAALPPGVQSQLTSPDPEQAVRGLAWLRSLAFSSGDLRLLEQVNVPGSPAAVADERIGAMLRESGRVLAGFTTDLSGVARTGEGGGSVAVVAVTASTSAYQEHDASGTVLAEAAAAPEQRLRLVLAAVEGRWRVQDILPAGPGAPEPREAPATGISPGQQEAPAGGR